MVSAHRGQRRRTVAALPDQTSLEFTGASDSGMSASGVDGPSEVKSDAAGQLRPTPRRMPSSERAYRPCQGPDFSPKPRESDAISRSSRAGRTTPATVAPSALRSLCRHGVATPEDGPGGQRSPPRFLRRRDGRAPAPVRPKLSSGDPPGSWSCPSDVAMVTAKRIRVVHAPRQLTGRVLGLLEAVVVGSVSPRTSHALWRPAGSISDDEPRARLAVLQSVC
jgi:hypothetical protein